jgi:ComF family protein
MDARPWLSTLLERRWLYNGAQAGPIALPARTCLVCGDAGGTAALCDGCIADLPRRAAPLLRRPIAGVSAAYACFDYAFPVADLVRAGKFSGDLCALDALAERLAAEMPPEVAAADCIVPVPLAPLRYTVRGFNQALELARPLAAVLGRPLVTSGLRRRWWHRPQSSLRATARARNVRDAFCVTADFTGRAILVVDDVVTTGATLAALARALRRRGAADVWGIAIAATPRGGAAQVSRLVTVSA